MIKSSALTCASESHAEKSPLSRSKVRDVATLEGGLELVDIQTATDGTRKLLFKLTVRL